MSETTHRGGWVIIMTILLSLDLAIMPLPEVISQWRPEWTALVLIYWALALPDRVGVGIAWCVGILQDVLQVTVLGAHGLAFALIVYLTVQLYQRLRLVPIWQQMITVFILLLINRMLLLWIRGVMGDGDVGWQFWAPAVTSTLIWPLVFLTLRAVRRRFRVQ